MLATDPLSLVFLGCVVFSGAFLLISMFSGVGHGHATHLGHAGHVAGHVAGHAGHVGHAGAAHATPTGHGGATAPAAGGGALPPTLSLAALWASASATLLGSLNLFSLLTFLFVFGLFGYTLHNATNLGDVLTILLPILLGIGAAMALGVVLTRVFDSDVGLLSAEDSQLEGRLGRVSMTIHAGGVGEVIFTRPGAGRQSIGARSADELEIPVNAEVVILNVRQGIATIQTWDSFIRSVRAGRGPALEALEPGP